MLKSLFERVHPDGLPLIERLLDILPPDALNAEVLEHAEHGLVVDVDGADSLLAVLAHQVVRVSEWRSGGVDAADDHHGGAHVVDDLDAGERLDGSHGVDALQGASGTALALVPEPQAVLLRLLHYPDPWFWFGRDWLHQGWRRIRIPLPR